MFKYSEVKRVDLAVLSLFSNLTRNLLTGKTVLLSSVQEFIEIEA